MGHEPEPNSIKHWRDMLATHRGYAYEYAKLLATDSRDVISKQKLRDEQRKIAAAKSKLDDLGAPAEDDPIDTYDPDETIEERSRAPQTTDEDARQSEQRSRSVRPTTAGLRQFLTDTFSDEEISTFCFDHFPEVYSSFATGMTKGRKIQLLLEYCQTRDVIKRLIAALYDARPEQYSRRFSHLETPNTPTEEIPTGPPDVGNVVLDDGKSDVKLERIAGD